jgi:hypothetical protein
VQAPTPEEIREAAACLEVAVAAARRDPAAVQAALYQVNAEALREVLFVPAEPDEDEELPTAAQAGVPAIPMSVIVSIALGASVPAIAFGFTDNFVMILAGSEIDTFFGAALGFSTMASAGLGNLVADVMGTGFAGVIEKNFGVKHTNLSRLQRESDGYRRSQLIGRMLGIALGCLLGMIPLIIVLPGWARDRFDSLKRALGAEPDPDRRRRYLGEVEHMLTTSLEEEGTDLVGADELRLVFVRKDTTAKVPLASTAPASSPKSSPKSSLMQDATKLSEQAWDLTARHIERLEDAFSSGSSGVEEGPSEAADAEHDTEGDDDEEEEEEPIDLARHPVVTLWKSKRTMNSWPFLQARKVVNDWNEGSYASSPTSGAMMTHHGMVVLARPARTEEEITGVIATAVSLGQPVVASYRLDGGADLPSSGRSPRAQSHITGVSANSWLHGAAVTTDTSSGVVTVWPVKTSPTESTTAAIVAFSHYRSVGERMELDEASNVPRIDFFVPFLGPSVASSDQGGEKQPVSFVASAMGWLNSWFTVEPTVRSPDHAVRVQITTDLVHFPETTPYPRVGKPRALSKEEATRMIVLAQALAPCTEQLQKLSSTPGRDWKEAQVLKEVSDAVTTSISGLAESLLPPQPVLSDSGLDVASLRK